MSGKDKKEKTKKGGGGIGFLIRNDIANIIDECEQNTDPKSETKWMTKNQTTNMYCSNIRTARKCTNRKGRGTISRTNHRHKHL